MTALRRALAALRKLHDGIAPLPGDITRWRRCPICKDDPEEYLLHPEIPCVMCHGAGKVRQ